MIVSPAAGGALERIGDPANRPEGAGCEDVARLEQHDRQIVAPNFRFTSS